MPSKQVGSESEPPERQRLPQRPQWTRSRRTSTSQPFAATWSQSAKPALQAMMRHAPFAQEAMALGRLQRLSQPPQWLASVWVSTSQPLGLVLSQLAKPAKHEAMVHMPLVQALAALASAQRLSQAPQWFGIVGSTHAPLQPIRSAGQGVVLSGDTSIAMPLSGDTSIAMPTSVSTRPGNERGISMPQPKTTHTVSRPRRSAKGGIGLEAPAERQATGGGAG